MNRRQILVAGGLAAVSAVAFGKNGVPMPSAKAGLSPAPPRPIAAPCALLPIDVEHRVVRGDPIRQLQIATFWPGEVATGITRLNFDLQAYDQSNLPQWIYPWQLHRSRSGLTMPSNGLRMRFEFGAQLDLTATISDSSGTTRVFNARLPNGTLMVLATARRLTGRPPLLTDLRYDPGKGSLYLADRSPRDFDALLLHTT